MAERYRYQQGEFDSRYWDPPGELRGINLRSWLVLELSDSYWELSVAQLCERLRRSGWKVEGRLSKVVSDALRWEVARGRVRRLKRGWYASGHLARSTKHRMRRRLMAARSRAVRAGGEPGASDELVALTRNESRSGPHEGLPDLFLAKILAPLWPTTLRSIPP